MASCTDEMDTDITASYEGEQPGMTEVSLNLGGDFIDIYDTPLTRAEGQQKKKLYAVNVLYDTLNTVKDPAFKLYAFGLFDDISKMKIKLSDNFQYKFVCSVVREDMEELQTWWTDLSKSGTFYSYPFVKIDNFINTMLTATYDKPGATEAEDAKKIQAKLDAQRLINRTANINKFTYYYGLVENLDAITDGTACVKCIDNWTYRPAYWTWERKVKQGFNESFKWLAKEACPKNLFTMKSISDPISDTLFYVKKSYPAIDRWYGELEEYTVDKGNPTIDLKRTAFGLKIVIAPPTEGTVWVISPELVFNTEVKASNNSYMAPVTFESIFSLSGVASIYKDLAKNPDKIIKQKITFQVMRERGDGSMIKSSKEVEVKRNRLTTVYIDSEKMSDASFGITENESMEPDTTIIVK